MSNNLRERRYGGGGSVWRGVGGRYTSATGRRLTRRVSGGRRRDGRNVAGLLRDLRRAAAVGVEGRVSQGHELRPQLFHLLGDHLDLTLWERGHRGRLVRGPQGEEVHERTGVAGGVHR